MGTCIKNCLAKLGLKWWIIIMVVAAIMGAIAATGGGGAIILALAIKGALLGMGIIAGTIVLGCITNCAFGKR